MHSSVQEQTEFQSSILNIPKTEVHVRSQDLYIHNKQDDQSHQEIYKAGILVKILNAIPIRDHSAYEAFANSISYDLYNSF